jgi:hypothetical protein
VTATDLIFDSDAIFDASAWHFSFLERGGISLVQVMIM